MTDVTPGQTAPELHLPVDGGDSLTLSALKGKMAVVYFYPKDDTSGCTAQAQAFTRLAGAFRAAGASVIGVSRDSVASHERFKTKHALDVILASDADGRACEDWGVWVEKSMYGRKYMGIERTTFLIAPDGRVAEVWRKVKVPGHAEAVLKAVEALAAAGS